MPFRRGLASSVIEEGAKHNALSIMEERDCEGRGSVTVFNVGGGVATASLQPVREGGISPATTPTEANLRRKGVPGGGTR